MGFTRRKIIKSTTAVATLSAMGLNPLKAQSNEPATKVIPKSGERIAVIGIGTNRYRVSNDSESEKAPLRATLKRFYELGGKLIDTAPRYGNSESVLGDLISDLGIQKAIFMATKCNMNSASETKEQMGESAKTLGWDIIDLMQVHSLRGWREQLPAMNEWKQAGRIRYTGVTASRDVQHDELADILDNHNLDFVQLNYSLLARNAEQKLLPMAKDKGIAVLVNLPFGRGRLFNAVGDRALPSWAAEFDCDSWGQFFLKYVISHPAVTCAIPGTRKVHHAVDNMGAAAGKLPDADIRKRQQDFIASL